MDKTFIDKLALIYVKDSQLLFSMSRGKDTWYVPGGKREAGEDDVAALKREVKEELSVDLVPESIEYYGTFEAQAHGKPEGTIVRMTCYTAEVIGELQASREIERIGFFGYRDRFRKADVDVLIMDDLFAKRLIK